MDHQERAQRLMKLLIDVPAERFTLGELLFITTRFRYSPATPEPAGVGNFDEEDLAWLERIARRVSADAGDVH